MFEISKIDHVGIRVSDQRRAIEFYGLFGFELISDSGFEVGHPTIMEHACGIVLNLLGPASDSGHNILMDAEAKPPGYTHMALRVDSLDALREFLAAQQIEVTGGFEYGGVRALFIRDPDRTVIEFDEYQGDEPGTRTKYEHERDHP